MKRPVAAFVASLALAPAFANHTPGHIVWQNVCTGCHIDPPGGNQVNAGNTTNTVLNYVIANQSSMMVTSSVTSLTPQQRTDVSNYILSTLPGTSVTTPLATPVDIDVFDNVTLSLTFTSIQTVSGPAHGTLSAWTGTSVTYTPAAGYVGPDSFTYRGIGNATGDARTVNITVSKGDQTITFPAQTSPRTYALPGTFTLAAATASSGLAVAYSSLTTGVCTVSGTTVTMVASGTCTIQANQAGNALYNAAPAVNQGITINKGNQAISFNVTLPATTSFSPGSFSLAGVASASSGLAVAYSGLTPSVCTVAGATVTLVTVGLCTVAVNQAGNAVWNAASQVTGSTTVVQAAQAITFAAQSPAAQSWSAGGSFAVNPVATASSGLAVTYGSSTPTVCTVSGTTVTIQSSAGTCTITANQAGNANWLAATQATQSVTINAVAPGAPTGLAATAGDTLSSFAFSPPASDGGSPITGYRVTCNPGALTGSNAASPVVVNGLANNVTYTCSAQALTGAFPSGGAASSTVTTTPQPTPVPPTIDSASATTFTVGSAGSFTVTATGVPTPSIGLTSGAPPSGVSFTPGTGSATLAGTPALGTVGTYNLVIGATGTAPAAAQNFTLTVQKRSQSITFAALANLTYSAAPVALSATSSVGFTVAFSSATPLTCSVSGTQFTMLDSGTCTINADQAGDGDTLAAATVSRTFTISKANQSITFGAQAGRTFAPGGTFTPVPAASASSGLAVAYSSATPAVCTVAGTTVTIVSAGTCTIVAAQAGDSRYNPAASVNQDVAIGLASQSITFPAQAPATRTFAPGAPFAVNPVATASSGLAVAYSSLTTGVCTVSGSTVTMVAVGACTIAANQAGDGNYTAAAQATASVTINADVPGAPTGVAATSANARAVIAFTAPAFDGGSPITGYTVSCSPGNVTASGAASPITVTGLANDTTYSCTVRASNGAGPGAASAAVPVTPAVNLANGTSLYASACASCHGATPSGTLFNAANADAAILGYVIANQPQMKVDSGLAALTVQDQEDIVAYLRSLLPAVQATVAPGVAKVIDVGSSLVLPPGSTFGTFTQVAVVTPPAHGTLSAFTGTKATYTPAPGYSGPDTFTFRGENPATPANASSARPATIDVNASLPVLTVQRAGPGGGAVASLPAGIDCGTDCTEAPDLGTTLVLTATPDAFSNFTGWSGACTGAGTCSVTLAASQAAIATFDFKPGVTFKLGVLRTGAGGGIITSPTGPISCTGFCVSDVAAGAVVALTATPDRGSVFTGWSGACGGTGACVVTMNGARNVTATFAPSSATLVPSTATLDFGVQSMATTSPLSIVTLTNGGTAPLTISGVSSSNPQFTVTHACATLAPAAGCTVAVAFKPDIQPGILTAMIPVGGTLDIAHDAQGATSVLLLGTAEKSLVSHFYRSILRRAPDDLGLDFWQTEVERMQNDGAGPEPGWWVLAMAFYGSAEYRAFGRDDAAFVTDLYNTFYNRAPDGAGLGYWTGQLASGLPRDAVLAAFMFSPEFAAFNRAIFGGAAARPEYDVVSDFYRGLLGRLPDSAGFANWVGRFRAAQCDASAAAAVGDEARRISSQFLASAEFAGRGRDDPGFVSDLYDAFMRRGADLAGNGFWSGMLAGGTLTRDQVRLQFVGSPEFQARVAAIAAAGCLP